MLKFNFVPKYENKPFRKLEVNFGSPLETIALGNPCNLKISFMKIFAMELDLYVDLTIIKCDAFVNFSTTIMMNSHVVS